MQSNVFGKHILKYKYSTISVTCGPFRWTIVALDMFDVVSLSLKVLVTNFTQEGLLFTTIDNMFIPVLLFVMVYENEDKGLL